MMLAVPVPPLPLIESEPPAPANWTTPEAFWVPMWMFVACRILVPAPRFRMLFWLLLPLLEVSPTEIVATLMALDVEARIILARLRLPKPTRKVPDPEPAVKFANPDKSATVTAWFPDPVDRPTMTFPATLRVPVFDAPLPNAVCTRWVVPACVAPNERLPAVSVLPVAMDSIPTFAAVVMFDVLESTLRSPIAVSVLTLKLPTVPITPAAPLPSETLPPASEPPGFNWSSPCWMAMSPGLFGPLRTSEPGPDLMRPPVPPVGEEISAVTPDSTATTGAVPWSVSGPPCSR